MARTVKVALIASAIVGGAAGVAHADQVNVGGGVWNYGATATIWSNYYHGSRCHGSSVQNGYGHIVRSGNTAAGYWATASMQASFNGNQAYWRNTC